jgi:hypothetical protein
LEDNLTYLNPRDFYMETAKGNTGMSYVNKFGLNLDVDAAEDVWLNGGTITWPTSAESLEIVSSSTNDDGDPAGTGARTVRIYGVDGSWAAQQEDVTLNGTTAVALANTYFRVNRMKVLTAGSLTSNEGTLTLRVASAGATRLTIGAAQGQSLYAAWTLPTGTTGYIRSWYADLLGGSPAGVTVDMTLWVREAPDNNGAWTNKERLGLVLDGTSYFRHIYEPPIAITGPADIRIAANPSAANTLISAGFTLLYE